MSEVCFPFIEMPKIPPKPRKVAQIVLSDRSLATQEAKNVLEVYGDLIDYVKFSDHVGNFARLSPDWVSSKAELWHSHGIKVFVGGIIFEVAALQNKVEPTMKRLKELGIDGVEISEDVIPPLPLEQRLAYIEMARKIGLEPFTEVGRKDPTAPLDAAEAIESIRTDLAAGSQKVAVENADIALLMKGDATPLKKIVDAVGLEPLVFETGPHGYPGSVVWLVKLFGPDINMENVYPEQLNFVDNTRRGMGRAVNYEFLSKKGGKVG